MDQARECGESKAVLARIEDAAGMLSKAWVCHRLVAGGIGIAEIEPNINQCRPPVQPRVFAVLCELRYSSRSILTFESFMQHSKTRHAG